MTPYSVHTKTKLVIFLLIFSACVSVQSLEDRYRQFQQQAKQSYTDFRDAANLRYADFLRSAWEYYKAAPAIPQPKEEQVPPVVYDDEHDRQRKERQQQQEQQGLQDSPLPYEDIVTQPSPTPQPTPVAPVIENNQSDNSITVSFYGAAIPIRVPYTKFSLKGTSPDQLAAAWEQLASEEYDNMLYDCLIARQQLQLCDWAYLCFLQTLCEQICGKTNAAVFMQAFLYAQSGYQMRLAIDATGSRLYLLIGSQYVFYDRGYFELDEGKFFPLTDISKVADGLNICNGAFEKEQPLSLQITNEQHLAYQPSPMKTRKAQSGLTAEVCVNRNLIDFYNTYPTGHYGYDFSTRWAMYANTPLDENIRQQLYPALKQAIRGVPELQAVSLLLNWVQTAFEYEYDDVVWGHDRAFFPAESLYYPYCDCEDRSILFSRLVRDLLGLDVVLLYYPGHLATAVCFNQPVRGDYLTICGKHYTVCDPTYIGAPVGATMPDMDNLTAKVIRLNK